MDIMAVAAALGAGATEAVDEVVGEFVPRPVFVAEVRELLAGAEDRAAAFETALAEKEVRHSSARHACWHTRRVSPPARGGVLLHP